jgi:hypothetical protein
MATYRERRRRHRNSVDPLPQVQPNRCYTDAVTKTIQRDLFVCCFLSEKRPEAIADEVTYIEQMLKKLGIRPLK